MTEIDISGFLIFGLFFMIILLVIGFIRSAKNDLIKNNIPDSSEFTLCSFLVEDEN